MFLLLLAGCQDVIEVDVPVDKPRLVIDGVIRLYDTLQPTVEVQVTASITSPFFEEIQPAHLTGITLTNSTDDTSVELDELGPNSGVYKKEVQQTMLTQGVLLLTIDYEGQNYVASTQFVPSVPIDSLVQGEGTLFTGKETEVQLSFTDAPDRTDFYLFDFDFNQYLVSEDTFYPGQSFQFSYFYDEDLQPGTELQISILGVDESFFNYMNQLIVQSGGDQGPFQTQSATVKGNIVNTSEPGNFALGYFAVCQAYSDSLLIKEK
ncbi:MAG: DUF4249 domain-containing protein [Maribacter sp.]|nr:DUF4249 domain-containing protein [Maribacter sp.]